MGIGTVREHSRARCFGPRRRWPHDTREICRELLDMSDTAVDELVAAGVLELPHVEQVGVG